MGLRLHATFHLNPFIMSPSTFRDEKPQMGKFWHFGGSCTKTPLPMRAKFGILDVDETHIYAYLPNSSRSVYSVSLEWRKTPNLPYFGFGVLWCRQSAAYREMWTWVHKYKPSPSSVWTFSKCLQDFCARLLNYTIDASLLCYTLRLCCMVVLAICESWK